MLHAMTQRSTSPRAFTLVEILIVVAILGILAALVVPRFAVSTNEARETGVERQLQVLRSQISLYESREGNFPASVVAGTDWSDMVTGEYLKLAPRNPLRQNQTTIAVGATIAAGAAIPGGAAWYYATDTNIVYAADADGNRYDF